MREKAAHGKRNPQRRVWRPLLASACALGAASAGCATPAATRHTTLEAAPAIVAEAAPAEPHRARPRTLIVIGDAPCGEAEDPSYIAQLLHGDARAVPDAFAKALGSSPDLQVVLSKPDQKQLREELAKLSKDRGLLLIYSGHGTEVPDAAGRPRSALCIPEVPGEPAKPLLVATVLGWMEEHKPAWASLILSACQSAYVDVSRQTFRVSALSISPEDVEESAPRQQDALAMTHVAAALGDALSSGAALDESCDGWISDRELADGVADRLRKDVLFVQRSLIMPRVRRQADQPLQLWTTDAPANGRCAQQIDQARRALQPDQLAELELRARGTPAPTPSGAPGTPALTPAASYFYLQDARAHAACAARAGDASVVEPGSEPPPQDESSEICEVLKGAGWRALAPRTPGLDAARAVALSFDFADVYHVHAEDHWIHVDRLRDGRRIATHRGGLRPLDLPARDRVVAQWPAGDFVALFGGKVSALGDLADPRLESIATARDRVVAVCAVREGQCFFEVAVPAPAKVTQIAAPTEGPPAAPTSGAQEGANRAR